jgi:hypothetical protein
LAEIRLYCDGARQLSGSPEVAHDQGKTAETR